MSRRRSRSQSSIDTRGRVFHDSADSHAEPIPRRGAIVPSLPQNAVPPAGVHRLEGLERLRALDAIRTDDRPVRIFSSGYGAEPHVSPRVRRTLSYQSLVLGRKPVKAIRVGFRPTAPRPIPLLQIQRRIEGWKQFNKLPLSRKVDTCVRRFQRKSVLFARQIAGKGRRLSGGRGGTYHRNHLSSYSCSR